jgi:hypothetical protein
MGVSAVEILSVKSMGGLFACNELLHRRFGSLKCHHESARAPPRECHHELLHRRFGSPKCHHGSATTRVPPRECHHESATTRVPPRECHHGSATTRVPPRECHHESATTRVPHCTSRRQPSKKEQVPARHHESATTRVPPRECRTALPVGSLQKKSRSPRVRGFNQKP